MVDNIILIPEPVGKFIHTPGSVVKNRKIYPHPWVSGQKPENLSTPLGQWSKTRKFIRTPWSVVKNQKIYPHS